MKKVKNILLLLTAIFTLGCSQTIVFEDIQTPTPTPTPKPEPEPDIDSSSYIDLSAEGTANCYLVKAAGKYKLKAVKGNSTQSVGAASSATVLWESFGTSSKPNEGDLIASATYKDGYVYFATPNTFKSGNASIAVRDSNAKILWSWHIWLSKEGWNDHIYANNAGTMMDRNLGATSATPGSVSAFGLLYQWGRKDPFLGSSSISSNTLAVSTGSWSSVSTQQTVDYVTANPMIFVCGYYEWCTGDGAEDSNYAKRWTESTKSMYDPCPVGYRVPEGGENGFWATALGTSSETSAGTTWDSTNKGRHWTLSDGTAAWYPAVGYRSRDSGALNDVGSNGYCWSASPNPSYSYRAFHLSCYNGYVSLANYSSRSRGYSVRCVSTTATSVPTPEPTEPANNEIWYTSTDGNVVTPNKSDVFDSKITSNTYENGKGVIKFETDLTQIGNWAFSDCVKFKTITFPNSLKRIGEFSFYGCTNIAEIIIPQGVVSIGSNAFNCSTGLARVTIPNSVTSIGLNPFQACSGMAEFNGKFASEDGRCLIVNNELISFAPAELTEYTLPESVVYIADNSFIDCTKIEKIIIPNNVSRIGEWSFYRCESITSIDIPESMKEVKEYAFCQCEKLNSVLCASPTPFTLGASVFDSNASDRKIYVPASSVSAYKSASGWSTYADAIVADPASEPTEPANNEIWYTSTDGAVIAHNSGSVSGANIVSNTYTNGKGVLTFNGNVTKILSNPFSAKSKLKSIVLPNSVTHIYPQAFGICYNLVDVDLGSGLTYIGNAAFDACSALTSITIPDSVTFIGPAPFLACYNLANFYGAAATDDHKGLVIDNTFVSFAPAGPTEYSIPHGVTVIQDGSFNDCQKITKVTIPATVVEIEEQAFYRCYALSVVNCLPTTPPTLLMHSSYGTFDSNASGRKIYVPASSVSAYKSASGWSTYADAIVADPASTPDLDYSTATDLSAEGTANCYLVKVAGTYKFKAVKGNSTQSVGAASSATVLWESFGTSTTPNEGDLITSATYKDGYVYFATPTTFNSGNASIAVRDSSGTVLWSWHIWCSAEGWTDDIYPNNAGTMMDRNLGATSATPGDVGAFGLLYQWGRKDPFMGSCAISGTTLAASTGSWDTVSGGKTIDWAEENPTAYITGSEWCTGDGAEDSNYTKRWAESEKTMYDPCPVGYRVPDGGDTGFWATALDTSSSTSAGTTWDSTNKGRHWTLSDGTTAWYPAVGSRSYDSGSLNNVGEIGCCWSASSPFNAVNAYRLYFGGGVVYPSFYKFNRSHGYSVRCVRE